MITTLAYKKKVKPAAGRVVDAKTERRVASGRLPARNFLGTAFSADYSTGRGRVAEAGAVGRTKDTGGGTKKDKPDSPDKKPADPCLLSFTISDVEGPFTDSPDGGCRLWTHFNMAADFSDKCDCTAYEYYQEIKGFYHKTRDGETKDLPVAMTGGIIPPDFREDMDLSDKAAPHYGHRDEKAEEATNTTPENRYVKAKGETEQKKGCGYRGTDEPRVWIVDCKPGDSFNLSLTFRGSIRKNGSVVAQKTWIGMDVSNWMPKGPKPDAAKPDPKKATPKADPKPKP
jgi:hypothetical protein